MVNCSALKRCEIQSFVEKWMDLETVIQSAVLCVLAHVYSCDPIDCSLPGSSVHGVLQARILEWVAMPSSRGSSQPRD